MQNDMKSHEMIFHEIYSIYFNAVTRIIRAVLDGKSLNKELYGSVLEKLKLSDDADDFLKAGLGLEPDPLLTQNFGLFDEDGIPKVTHCNEMPLTLIEKRWLKTILCDPRIKLFNLSDESLNDVAPFYLPEDIYVYDRPGNSDPWTDANYIKNFNVILNAIKHHSKIDIKWLSRESLECSAVCIPEKFEYSELDDRMRVWADTDDAQIKIVLNRVISCDTTDAPLSLSFPPQLQKPLPKAGTRFQEQQNRAKSKAPESEKLILEIVDERNALERIFIHFSGLKKEEVEEVGYKRYKIVICIDYDDHEELANRVLSFGPMVRVIEPDWLKAEVGRRLNQQCQLHA